MKTVHFKFVSISKYQYFWDSMYDAFDADVTAPDSAAPFACVTVYRDPTTADNYADTHHVFELYVDAYNRCVWKNDFDYNETKWCATHLSRVDVVKFLRLYAIKQ